MERSYKRRSYRKGSKRQKMSRSNAVVMAPTLNIVPGIALPDSTEVVLEWCFETLLFNNGNQSYNARGNSLFSFITGSKPVGYDKWMSIYQKYYVRAASIEVTAANTNTSNTPGAVVVTLLPSETGDTTEATAARGNEYSKSVYLSKPFTKFNTGVLKGYMTTDKIFGKDTSTDDDYYGNSSVGPTKQWYFNINVSYAKNSDWVNYNTTIQLYFKMKYYIKFSDLRPQL